MVFYKELVNCDHIRIIRLGDTGRCRFPAIIVYTQLRL